MWKVYLKSDEGIAIKSTFKLLTESFGDCEDTVYIGKVIYIDYKSAFLHNGLLANFMHKRRSYEFENELRVLVLEYPSPGQNQMPFEKGKHVPIKLDVLIEEIFVSPDAPEWFNELVRSVAEKYNLRKAIKQSSLADEPLR